MKMSFLSLLFLFLPLAAGAVDYTWNGGTDDDWDENSNWYGGTSPGASLSTGDTLTVDTTVNDPATHIPAGFTVDALTITAGSLALSGSVIVTNALTQSGGTIVSSGAVVTVGGDFVQTGGAVTGSITISANGTTGIVLQQPGNALLGADLTAVAGDILLSNASGGILALTANAHGAMSVMEDGDIDVGAGGVSAGGTVQFSPKTMTHTIVYGPNPPTPSPTTVWYSSARGSITAGSFVIGSTNHEGNIFINNVGVTALALTVDQKSGGAGAITVMGTYDTSITNNPFILNSGMGGVVFDGAVMVDLGGAAFTVTGGLNLAGAAGASTVTAAGISLGSIAEGGNSGDHSLALDAGTGNVSLNGDVGAANKPKDITISGTVVTLGAGKILSAGGKLKITGDTTNNGTIIISETVQDSISLTINTVDMAIDNINYSVEFNGKYTEAGAGKLSGEIKDKVFVGFGGDVEFLDNRGGYTVPANPAGWFVFKGTIQRQAVNVNIAAGKEFPNVLVYLTASGNQLAIAGSATANPLVFQDERTLYIRRGTVNLGLYQWLMNSTNSPMTRIGFDGLSGTFLLHPNASFVMGDSSTSTESVFYPGPGLGVTANGTISVTGDFTLAPYTGAGAGFSGATIIMRPVFPAPAVGTDGRGLNVPSPYKIGNLVVEADNIVTIAADLEVSGGITVLGTLNAGPAAPSQYDITLGGDWIQSNAGGTVNGVFNPYNRTVTFSPAAGTTIKIDGVKTTWYNFVCTVPGTTIAFRNYPVPPDKGHYIAGEFIVRGDNTPGGGITLTRLNVTAAGDDRYWDLFYHVGETNPLPDKLEYVTINWSWARNSLFVPESANVRVLPALTYHNMDWQGIFMLYSYTEDTDNNGKIDRLRIQGYDAFLNVSNLLDGFKVRVEGYETLSYSVYMGDINVTPHLPGMIYVKLKEKDAPDTGVRPKWTVIQNTSVKDPGGRLYRAMDWNTPVDTAPPRMVYSLAMPGERQIFVRMSEPVHNAVLGEPVTITRSGGSTVVVNGGHTPVTSKDGGVLEFLINAGAAPFTPWELISGELKFSFNNGSSGAFRDIAIPVNPVDAHPLYYPLRHGVYADDITAYGIPAAGTRPPNLNRADPSEYEHRATDLLISAPPRKNTRFIIHPVWARNGGNETWIDDYYGVIRQFDGTAALGNMELTMQCMIDDDPTDGVPSGVKFDLVYALVKNVPDEYRSRADNHGIDGLWLPGTAMVPRPFAGAGTIPGQPQGNRFFNFVIPPGVLEKDSTLEFYFSLAALPPPFVNPDLYAARLDIKSGAAVPSNWYHLVKPFSFSVTNITTQRGGVTILNNVINPDRGERTYVNYMLSRGGRVTIQVFTLDGTLVKVLEQTSREAGNYGISWDGKNNGGRPVARGLYFIRVVAPDIDEIRKVMIVK